MQIFKRIKNDQLSLWVDDAGSWSGRSDGAWMSKQRVYGSVLCALCSRRSESESRTQSRSSRRRRRDRVCNVLGPPSIISGNVSNSEKKKKNRSESLFGSWPDMNSSPRIVVFFLFFFLLFFTAVVHWSSGARGPAPAGAAQCFLCCGGRWESSPELTRTCLTFPLAYLTFCNLGTFLGQTNRLLVV